MLLWKGVLMKMSSHMAIILFLCHSNITVNTLKNFNYDGTSFNAGSQIVAAAMAEEISPNIPCVLGDNFI